MATAPKRNYYYTNPGFSQHSEFYNGRPLSQVGAQGGPNKGSGGGSTRQSPIGAQAPLFYAEGVDPELEDEGEEEQEFYEEMLVDDTGVVKQKKMLMVSSPHTQAGRYEYIPMQEQIPVNPMGPNQQGRLRYLASQEAAMRVSQHRYEYIQEERQMMPPPPPQQPSQQYSQQQYPQSHRYEYISASPKQVTPNAATQKLHELLQTPPKRLPTVVTTNSLCRPVMSPQAQRRTPPSPAAPPTPSSPSPPNYRSYASSPASPRLPRLQRDPFITPPKRRPTKPRAQQKLNYALGSRQVHQVQDKRSTAIVAPMCSSPIQSVYSETTFSHKTESWLNLAPRKPTQLTLAVAAAMMMLCGGVTSGLCFYMVSIMGRLYFLDFGIVAGFTCLILGLLGFRTRNCYWLPNRNYISGYIVLSVFSLLMCAGLLVLLVMQPKPGTPLADMTSGAVCGISVLSLLLASVGVITSYCCKYPPPDNRVQHCVQGFVV